ncbi:MAG: tetratricopeptide repeat protein [Candidatus Obscuribacterales bacterium]
MTAKKRTIAISIACLAAMATGAAAMADDLLSRGIGYYKAGQYPEAVRDFEFLLKEKPGYWPAHYELANTFMKMNQVGLARREYVTCVELKPDQKTDRICRNLIRFIDYSLSHRTVHQDARPDNPETPPDTGTATSADPGVDFKHRINVIKPVNDHPPVREITIENVSHTLETLPPNVYEVLNKGGATVNIAPNITDKWTHLLDGHPDDETIHLAQDAARCYGHDVYIYERAIIPGTHRLQATAFEEDGIHNVLLHELGHALDDCSGVFTATDEVMQIHATDVSHMSDATKARLWYYVPLTKRGSAEAFAETFAGLMGAQGKDTEEVRNNFPELRRWAKNKFRL